MKAWNRNKFFLIGIFLLGENSLVEQILVEEYLTDRMLGETIIIATLDCGHKWASVNRTKPEPSFLGFAS